MFTQKNREEKPENLRKKYEKPAVIYLAPLEAIATTCDPIGLWTFNAPFGAGCQNSGGKQPPSVCGTQSS